VDAYDWDLSKREGFGVTGMFGLLSTLLALGFLSVWLGWLHGDGVEGTRRCEECVGIYCFL
jgi:hypothetical protein